MSTSERTPIPAYAQTEAFATEKQIAFIHSLIDSRNLFADPQFFDKVNAMDAGEYAAYLDYIKQEARSVTKTRASEIIGKLKQLPYKDNEGPGTTRQEHGNWPEVLPGRYAFWSDGVLKFYKVDRPTEGRWAGYTFLAGGKGGPHGDPEWIPIRNPKEKRSILGIIKTGEKECAERYGQEIGECGICGRTLTDATSRALGIGPVCRSNSDWY